MTGYLLPGAQDGMCAKASERLEDVYRRDRDDPIGMRAPGLVRMTQQVRSVRKTVRRMARIAVTPNLEGEHAGWNQGNCMKRIWDGLAPIGRAFGPPSRPFAS